jgi:hypothetical protein
MRRNGIKRLLHAALACVAGLQLLVSQNAHAFKPFTHNWTAEQARQDALDGNVNINGNSYAINPAVLNALQKWPTFYNAGVIGPDGFPDLTFGQSVIHPVKTGEWLRHIFNKAWEAQSDSSYSSDEKEQILAFAYGYLSHAAGDMWAHTIVNDFALGVFPSVGDILTSVDEASIAFRHLVVEGYIGDFTPGFDGNPARSLLPNGDYSDDSTPSFGYNAPHRFIYEVLVKPSAQTPVMAQRGLYREARGPVLGFFMEMNDDIGDYAAEDPDPLADSIAAFDDTLAALMAVAEDCNFEDVEDGVHDAFFCPAALLELGFTVLIDSAQAFHELVSGTAELLAGEVLDAYIAEWRLDIDGGMMNWGKFGLATTRGLFDAQSRRDYQNQETWADGDDGLEGLRADKEDQIGILKVVLHESDAFINDHLLSMMGLPDFVGDVREILGEISDVFDDILAYAGMPFNPLEEGLLAIETFIHDLIKDAIKETIGVDVDTLGQFLMKPSSFVCLDGLPISLPAPIGDVTIPLFDDGTKARLDSYLGFSGNQHLPVEGENLPGACGPVADWAEFDPNVFAPARNAITLSKLLLLDGPMVNQVLSDILGRSISTYAPGHNIMIQALDPNDTWLNLIDGDHAWRADGAPRFAPRPEELTAGKGNFPLWESCVLRPAFRALFKDWENGAANFPDLGDVTSADPVNDPQAPESQIVATGNTYDNGSRLFLGADHLLTVSAKDAPAGRAFSDDELGLARRIYTDLPGSWIASFQNEGFKILGGDGRYLVDLSSEECCHTFVDEDGSFPGDPKPPEPTKTFEFFFDTTPPAVECGVPPFTLTFDTDDFSAVQYTVDDGALGSGVNNFSSSLNGYLTATGRVTVAIGSTLDMYHLYPGVRTVTIVAADNLGNTGTNQCTFELHATVLSLSNNLVRAQSEGRISDPKIYASLRAKLAVAQQFHLQGNHVKEHQVLATVIAEVTKVRGKHVEAVFADRFIAWTKDLIAVGN